MEIFRTIKCPKCNESLSMFKAREEFHCPKCEAVLRCENYSTILLISLAIYFAITFLLDLLDLNIFFVILYNVVIFLIVMRIFSKRIKCSVADENSTPSSPSRQTP